MKKLFTFLSRANNNSIGISFNHRRVSFIYSMLTIVAIMLMAPQGAKADIVTTTYDFTTKDWDKTVTYSSTTERNCTYFTKIGQVSEPGRFAAQNVDKWVFQRTDGNGITSNTIGLCNNYGSGRRFLVSKLYAGDKITFDVVGLNGSQTDVTIASESSGATKSNNTFTMTEKGSLVVWIANLSSIKYITIEHDNSASYAYDPAIEIYELNNSLIQNGGSSLGETLDYNIAGGAASLIANPKNSSNENNVSYYALNNRIAVQSTDFQWGGGLSTNKNSNQYRILSINNLRANDRVVITYNGNPIQFGTHHTDRTLFAAANIVFKDSNSNGDLDEDETYPQVCDEVESGTTYTMMEDGHLDIRVPGGATITKIIIYSDHQARMVDRYGENVTQGNTSYFDTTGQLEAKHHIVPGGLHVYVGNTNDVQHAEVQASDQGPVAFVYDQEHYKMARQSNGSTNVYEAAPATGTFLMFKPDVKGTMTVNFKAYSIKYDNYWNGNGNSDGNEHQTNEKCPYYLMVKNANGSFDQIGNACYYANNDNGKFENITVEPGNTYYIYGWWTNTEHFDWGSCGLAALLDVTFKPENYVYPLAKWVKSGATVDNENILSNLATVTGYSNACVKKKSDNIESCTVAIENGVLKVKSISYKAGANPGGVVLIKVGDPSIDANPVFALTIAYDASFNKPEGAARSEGHTWDFSSNPLNGLEWTDRTKEATVTDFGTSQNSNSLLSKEIAKGDWTFNYRVKASNGKTHDPRFLNNWDMEGDNADMMWDTEGLIFKTASNQSCIYNEYGSAANHTSSTDPDRYVGILPGGSFTIPALKAGDRVVIFMGSGDGSGDNACKFNITGALDAIGQEISSNDIYNGGGSEWKWSGGEYYYHGAYQFISTGGDMTFTMNGGSMTKLYSIKIYTGVKSATNDATKINYDLTYNDDEYIGANNSWWLFNDYRTVTPARSAYTMHFRGKGERLKTPVVLYKSGDINTDEDHLMYAEIGDNRAPYILFKSEKEQYGMFRMRIEDYELGYKYVADYGLQNVAVGYLEKKNYPYTWDFTDLMDYANTSTRIQKERTNVNNYAPKTVTGNYDIEFMNNTVGENVKSIEQWKEYAADGGIPAGYGLQVRNEPYNGGVMWYNGQLYAGDGLLNEASFLSIKVPEIIKDGKIEPDVNQNHNGGVRICNEGLCLTGGNWTITLPQVGTIASVYVRAKQVGNQAIYAAVGDVLNSTSFTYEGTANDGTGDKIYAVKGTGEDMKLMFNNLIIKKIAISQDPKTVNKLGYATESRNVEIDPELMGYMTGTGLKAYTVTKVVYGDNAGDIPSITLTEIPKTNVMGEATDGDHRGYIIYNTDDTKAVNILDNGFHLFVPDMHDKNGVSGSKKSNLDVENGKNFLRSCYTGGSIPQFEVIDEVSYTNYLMNYIYNDKYGSHEGPEAFYRAGSSASLGNNKAYLQLLTEKVRPTDASFSKSFAIIFEDEFNSINPGITTVIDNASSNENVNENNAEWYNLNGQKLNGKPSTNGLYIINGKKVVVK